jgi:hypothetical protein
MFNDNNRNLEDSQKSSSMADDQSQKLYFSKNKE